MATKRNRPPKRRGVEGQVVFGAYIPGEPEFFGPAPEAICGAAVASAAFDEDVRVRAYVWEGGKWTTAGDEYIVSVQRRGKIKRNLGVKGRSALDAFLGSLAWLLLSFATGAPGLVRWLGSIGGGALGGYLGAKRKGAGRRQRKAAATGGGIGGALGPLPAAGGAYIGADVGERKRNEERLSRRVRR